MKNLKLVLFVLIMLALFTGCAANQDARNGEDNTNFQTKNVGDDRNNNDQTRMEVADKAADKVTDLQEVSQANVIVTNRNAFVAVVLNENPKGELTRKVEEKISKTVKDSDNNINNVYVSTNPDFVNRMTDYGDRIQQGEPVGGLFDEFTEMVRRVFPNAR
jgi:spore cortex protein